MASRVETILGLTPMLKRMAHYYLCLGFGEHVPRNQPSYDRIVVKSLYDFTENPETLGEYAGGARVEFWFRGKRLKWVEFRCQVTGGGGVDDIKLVKG